MLVYFLPDQQNLGDFYTTFSKTAKTFSSFRMKYANFILLPEK